MKGEDATGMGKNILIYGDVFVDHIADDPSNMSFRTYLGGATVNVAAGTARLGAPVSFITVTGDDETSAFVRSELEKEGVDLSSAVLEPAKRVNGVYVHLTPDHDRVFANYENDTPDIQVTTDNLQPDAFHRASVFHFCSGTMFHPTARNTTECAVRLAGEAGALLSYDANIRPLRWDSEDECRRTTVSFLASADIVKLTEDELTFMMEAESVEEGLQHLAAYDIPVVLLTRGVNGTLAIIGGERLDVPSVPVEAVDTTGAGDAFTAGILSRIHADGLPDEPEAWREIIRFGNRLGALCVTKPGALSAMPYAHELQEDVNE
ncbi:aminoimidazole riboside kinase [Sporosarcina sp. NCCP-2716]|uniref:carbohydrate kinase family protein n=1 Tax=Sporosarcina sp. NCCP-2716 TaxID=2943679 RepID=UPI00204116D3|nr:carbohydrate kinase [Sporosarcina sp. NCCP-2716]GKV69254.1 aminoimidazole riboside kinase [Sporosarcina sp. NCCP-2716]